jgi:hypothetical protein
MKITRLLLIIVLAVFAGLSLNAQGQGKSKTDNLKVAGNCEMCKERIETAAKAAGAETATWDAKSKMLAIKYDPSKTSTDAVAKKVAAVGHDTEKYKAEDKVYNGLPGCCKYDRTAAPAANAQTKK